MRARAIPLLFDLYAKDEDGILPLTSRNKLNTRKLARVRVGDLS